MDRLESNHASPAPPASGGVSSSVSTATSPSRSRRNSFSLFEKPSDDAPALSSYSSFTSLHGLTSSRVSLLPMPVVTKASSALEAARSSFRWLFKPKPEPPSYLPLSDLSSPIRPSTPAPRRLRSLCSGFSYRRLIYCVLVALCALFVLLLTIFRHSHISDKGGPRADNTEVNPEAIWLNYTRLDGYFTGVRAVVPLDEYQPSYPALEDQELARLQEIAEAANKTLTELASLAQKEKRFQANAEPRAAAATTTAAVATSTTTTAATSTALTTTTLPMPTPSIFRPQPDYNSSEYRARFHPVHRCYLDAANTVPVAELWAYPGVPQGQPEPLFGSHSLLGMRDDVCFERFGRYGPYGLGYSKEEGGLGLARDTESEGSSVVWSALSTSGKIDYSNVDWADAQARCYAANKDRFASPADARPASAEYSDQLNGVLAADGKGKRDNASDSAAPASTSSSPPTGLQKIERTAVVMRCYVGFKWTPFSILNLRALVSEMALQSGGEYDVHILLHARDESIPVWADTDTANKLIADNIPREFRGLVTLWSEGQMRLVYPGMKDRPAFDNPAHADIHGVYRSPHLPLQLFAMQHPEYAYFWNWEMDMRFLGSYYEFFGRLGSWADKQPRRRIWDRSAKYYIPALHGSWENFTARVDAEAHEAGRPSILGKLFFAGRAPTLDEAMGVSPLPETCNGAVISSYNRTAPDHNSTAALPGRHFFADRTNNYTNISASCGVGEKADLITLNPMFDAEDSGWVFANDVTGYDRAFAIPPRRTAIITASRLSRRLLLAMHEETWRLQHGMFAEMFPPSIALHRGYKAVYAPHPVYTDRQWPLVAAEHAFNGGPDHSSGASHASPFHPRNEHFHRGMTWYYNSEFSGRLWRRWLGYPQPLDDPRAPKPKLGSKNANQGPTEGPFAGYGGGSGDEGRSGSTGRMCLRSVLVHPIKYETLDDVFGS